MSRLADSKLDPRSCRSSNDSQCFICFSSSADTTSKPSREYCQVRRELDRGGTENDKSVTFWSLSSHLHNYGLSNVDVDDLITTVPEASLMIEERGE